MKSREQTIVLATHNPGKIGEFYRILAHLPVRWLTLPELGIETKIHEGGDTFTENATIKAQGYCELTGHWTLADDSGLIVEALGGRPGIKTSRYGEEGHTQAEKWDLLLRELQSVSWQHRVAQFHCSMALALPNQGQVLTAQGKCSGRITFSPAGTFGFGYDPIFYIPQHGCTMAQLSPEIKDRISHRGRAVRALSPVISELLANRSPKDL